MTCFRREFNNKDTPRVEYILIRPSIRSAFTFGKFGHVSRIVYNRFNGISYKCKLKKRTSSESTLLL